MNYTIEQSPLAHFLFSSKKSALLWLIIRLYVSYEWIIAGYEKVINPAWFGSGAGAALNGFVQGALAQTTGAHPAVQMWYASFLQSAVAPNLIVFSNVVAVGELLVGVGLILGVLTGIAAFFGFFMNLNFLMAGAISVNPQMIVLSFLVMLAWRVAGYWGGDRYVQPWLRRHCRVNKRS